MLSIPLPRVILVRAFATFFVPTEIDVENDDITHSLHMHCIYHAKCHRNSQVGGHLRHSFLFVAESHEQLSATLRPVST